jgi:hypothetical protein
VEDVEVSIVAVNLKVVTEQPKFTGLSATTRFKEEVTPESLELKKSQIAPDRLRANDSRAAWYYVSLGVQIVMAYKFRY